MCIRDRIGGVKSDDTQTIAATTYELGLDDSGDLNALVVDLKDAFSSLSAATTVKFAIDNEKAASNFKVNTPYTLERCV